MDRLLRDQSYCSAKSLVIITTSSREGLGIEDIPNGKVINLSECPSSGDVELKDQLRKEFEPGLNDLVMTRPVYSGFQSQIRDLLQECESAPHLAQIVLNWLLSAHRGTSKTEIDASLKTLSPISSDNIVNAVLSSLEPNLKAKAEIVFDWIKSAAEPWSPGAIIEAINVYSNQGEEIILDDLDRDNEMAELIKALAGIIIVEGNDVKFSHPSLYSVIRSVKDQSIEESAAQVHSQIATACLRYFQHENAQSNIDEICSANFGQSWVETPLDTVVICHQRAGFAEYAVRFWPYHYKASGQSKPKELVYKLFNNKRSRAAWEIPFWLFSNSFTRTDRDYTSTLPVFARLGLEDLLDEQLESEKSHPWFNDNCWYSITEAVRAGSTPIVQKLLEQVDENEEELKTALSWAAAQDDDEILDVLLAKVHDKHNFSWPDHLIYRAAATGRNNLLTSLLNSTAGIDKAGTYWGATPSIIAAWQNQESALDLILRSDPKPNLAAEDNTGDSLLMAAVRLGNPRLIKLIVDAGATIDGGSASKDLIHAAIVSCSAEAVDILLEAGAELGSGHDVDEPPLVFAAANGLLDCVRIMLRHKADPDVTGPSGTALYRAVEKEHLDIVRLLLENDPKPSMDIIPEGQDSLLVRAILTRNTELVSLLIEHGAKVDSIDSNDPYNKTPLSRVCKEGYLDMVKLLLEKGADVNYTGEVSDAPLFAALYNHELDVARHLLQIEGVDVMWRDSGGMGTLHGAYNNPDILPELLPRKIPLGTLSIWGTPLHMTARDGCLESTEILLRNDPKPDLEVVMGENAAVGQEIGLTPLQLACRELALPCIKALLEAGANHKVVTNDDDLVDIVLQAKTDSSNRENVLELLLSTPYSLPIDRVNHEGRTRLHIIHESTSVAAFRLLMGSEPKLDARNGEGYTPLAVAIDVGNRDIAEFLIEQGASVNILSPKYGSILHLATSVGSLDLVKLLMKSGADPDLVDVQYGESILYTALGITDKDRLYAMVRYLVDEAKVPIDKMGGELAYPLIRAASLLREPPYLGTTLVKFLIRRNVRVNVSDGQGRRAMHFACLSTDLSLDAINALVKAREDVDLPDKLGRRPIHFAASNAGGYWLWDFIEKRQTSDVDLKDHDGWTPLMWAARSGNGYVIQKLLDKNADIWVQSNSTRPSDRWSALKLSIFTGQPTWIQDLLVPKELSRIKPDGDEEKWDEYAHKTKTGHMKFVQCSSCLVVGPSTITFVKLELTTCDFARVSLVCAGSVLSVGRTFRFASSAFLTSLTFTTQTTVSMTLDRYT
jgi:ankyrin repeat protein